MEVIVWSQPNGTLAVCIPTGELPIEDVIAKDVPADVVHKVVDLASLPVGLDDPMFAALRIRPDGSIAIDQAVAAAISNVVPSDIANWQAHAILEIRGKLSTVNAAIDAIQDPTTRIIVRRGFDGADRIPRNSPNLNAVLKGPGVGMTDAEIDQLFIDGSKLHA